MHDHRFTALALVGPGDKELTRLTDLMHALFHYEPTACHRFVLVDDPAGPRDLAALLPKPPSTCSLEVVPNPRDKGSQRITMALSPGVLAGLAQASQGDCGAHVLKLDTDALVVAPFSDRLGRFIDSHPQAGIVGACYTSPQGVKRGTEHQVRVFGNAAKWRVEHKDRQACGRRRRVPTRWKELAMLRTVRRAVRNGYAMGEHVMGGGYAVTATAVKRMAAAGLFNDLNLWVDTFASEDGVASLYAKLVGTTMVDYCGEGDVFGVSYRGLPFTMDEVVRRNYAVIHSLKNDANATEEQIRAYFAARRNTATRAAV